MEKIIELLYKQRNGGKSIKIEIKNNLERKVEM